MTEHEYAMGAQVLLLLGSIVLYITALLVYHLPACPHGTKCPTCERERFEKREADRRRTHDYWHRGTSRPVPGCPYCREDS